MSIVYYSCIYGFMSIVYYSCIYGFMSMVYYSCIYGFMSIVYYSYYCVFMSIVYYSCICEWLWINLNTKLILREIKEGELQIHIRFASEAEMIWLQYPTNISLFESVIYEFDGINHFTTFIIRKNVFISIKLNENVWMIVH